MDSVFRNFYRNFYLKTGGFIPGPLLKQNIYPGDFFQIRNCELMVLGNIFRNGIVDPENVKLESGIKLNSASWILSDGLHKGLTEGQTKFIFERKGSFLFRGSNPEAVKIVNWSDIQQQLIIKLTQTTYSFREVFVAMEAATTSDWILAIAGAGDAELNTGDHENTGLAYYQREQKRKPVFFKAKKLVVRDEKIQEFISSHLDQILDHQEWGNDFFNYEQADPDSAPSSPQNYILDMLQGDELNPNTALLYFKWADANLDDVERLFVDYSH